MAVVGGPWPGGMGAVRFARRGGLAGWRPAVGGDEGADDRIRAGFGCFRSIASI